MRASLRFHQNALLFEQARAGMGGDQRVCYVQGFCPAARLAEISSVAARHGWAILAADPGADDPPNPAETISLGSMVSAGDEVHRSYVGLPQA